jgi:glycogen debranching enzyme
MTEEVIRVKEDSYILATTAHPDDRTRVLKQGDTFAVFDRFGDIETKGTNELGLYYQDTRFLSRLTLKLERDRPLLLSSSIKDDNAMLAVDSTNPDIQEDGVVVIPRGTVHIFRTKFIWNGTCYERLRVHNYGPMGVELSLRLEFDADFADIFEIRGTERHAHGRNEPPLVQDNSVLFRYEGLDRQLRSTRIVFEPKPTRLTDVLAGFDIVLPPGSEKEYHYAVSCELQNNGSENGPAPDRVEKNLMVSYDKASRNATEELTRIRSDQPGIFTSNEQFNDWMKRSLVDLHMMRTETAYGPYPYAGIPWYCTAFGRDGIITALECLNYDPSLARGVLSYLAARQADSVIESQDAQPGKILHETRTGEMAALGEVPFKRYYGSVDATPLFVMLAGAYYVRTGDKQFVRSIWPNIERALAWIDTYGDPDGDGFVEYERQSPKGLVHQGWKDSHDSVFHADGKGAEGPIALCEVQGYVYAAKLAASSLAAVFGNTARASTLEDQAHTLKEQFEKDFWCEDISTYALALDKNKRPCKVRTSNAGHCLFTGIASDEHARRVATTLILSSSFNGWGIRTVAAGEARYNPMSYHNGSVWPHDNALIAAGFARYGFTEHAVEILTGFLDASIFFELHRVPELFCGFPRRPGEAPTLYPVACVPQTWAAGAIMMLLESCLGLTVLASERKVVFCKPVLPESLGRVSIRGLYLGDARVDLLIARHTDGDVGVNVLARRGEIEVTILK